MPSSTANPLTAYGPALDPIVLPSDHPSRGPRARLVTLGGLTYGPIGSICLETAQRGPRQPRAFAGRGPQGRPCRGASVDLGPADLREDSSGRLQRGAGGADV